MDVVSWLSRSMLSEQQQSAVEAVRQRVHAFGEHRRTPRDTGDEKLGRRHADVGRDRCADDDERFVRARPNYARGGVVSRIAHLRDARVDWRRFPRPIEVGMHGEMPAETENGEKRMTLVDFVPRDAPVGHICSRRFCTMRRDVDVSPAPPAPR
jgi:hypothetical protein